MRIRGILVLLISVLSLFLVSVSATTLNECGNITEAGVYYLNGSNYVTTGDCLIILANDVIIEGNGSFIYVTDGGKAISTADASGFQNITIQNLYLGNGGTGSGFGIYFGGNIFDLTVFNVEFEEFFNENQAGIFFSPSSEYGDISIVNNTFINNFNGIHGELGDELHLNGEITGNTFEVMENSAVSLDGLENWTIAYNLVTSSFGSGIRVLRSTAIRIDNNTLVDIDNRGVDVQDIDEVYVMGNVFEVLDLEVSGTAIFAYNIVNSEIKRNNISNQGAGFYFDGSDFTSMELVENDIRNVSTGFWLAGILQDILIANNTISTAGYGIRVENSEDFTNIEINGNVFEEIQTVVLDLGDFFSSTIIENNFSGIDVDSCESVIKLQNSEDNIINSNAVSGCAYGIEFRSNSRNNTVQDNLIENVQTGLASFGDNIENLIIHNRIYADVYTGQWIEEFSESDLIFNQYNNSESGNAWYIYHGGLEQWFGAWEFLDIVDTTGNNYSDSGEDRPFNEETSILGISTWTSPYSADWFPYTEVQNLSESTEPNNENNSDSSSTSSGGGGRVLQTFPVFGNDYSNGFTEGFYVGDKYVFEVKENSHTLTLNFRNSTTARVTIQSEQMVVYLEKDVLYEFDVDSDGVNDIRVRYDGIGTGNKAMLFIQGIFGDGEEDLFMMSPDFEKSSYWPYVLIFLVLVAGAVSYLYWKKNN